jgi:hypothetical protein
MRSRPRLPRGVLVATGPVVLVVAGIVGYLSFGDPPWTAVAMTLLTLTTVGFASGTRLSTGALVFSAGLALLGVGLFVAILGLAATAIVEGRVSLFSRSRRMRGALRNCAGTSSSAPTAGSAGPSPQNWKRRACRSSWWTARPNWYRTWNATGDAA